MEDLVALKYTAAQLRFAFVVLLDQDATPVTLFQRFEKHLLKDFVDRGVSVQRARLDVQRLLQLAWLNLGNDVSKWMLPVQTSSCSEASAATFSGDHGAKARALYKLIIKDKYQTNAVTTIMAAIRQNKDNFFFVHGRAGSGKSLIATYITYAAQPPRSRA